MLFISIKPRGHDIPQSHWSIPAVRRKCTVILEKKDNKMTKKKTRSIDAYSKLFVGVLLKVSVCWARFGFFGHAYIRQ